MVISTIRLASSGLSAIPPCKTHTKKISPSHGFRTNGANDRRNVHDRRVEEKKKVACAAGLICTDSFSWRRALHISVC